MSYLLDTNAVIALISDDEQVRRRFEALAVEGEEVFVSAIVYFELSYGVHKSKSPIVSNYRLESVIRKTAGVLEFSTDDASNAGRLRAYLESIKQPIGPYDTLIAGQALSRSMTLVTANIREFERVPGLSWQDWER